MGFALWVMAGVGVFAGSRLASAGRPERRIAEALIAIGTAILCGLIATALDFGGWNEPDWRAGVFALCGAAAAVGAVRALALARGRKAYSGDSRASGDPSFR